VEPMKDHFYDESALTTVKHRRTKMSDSEQEDLRDTFDNVSFNLGKAYQHAKDRSRKQWQRNQMRKRLHHTYKSEK